MAFAKLMMVVILGLAVVLAIIWEAMGIRRGVEGVLARDGWQKIKSMQAMCLDGVPYPGKYIWRMGDGFYWHSDPRAKMNDRLYEDDFELILIQPK